MASIVDLAKEFNTEPHELLTLCSIVVGDENAQLDSEAEAFVRSAVALNARYIANPDNFGD